METHEYRVMFERETDYWWYRGLHELILSVLREHIGPQNPARILDAGCGTGRMLELLQQHLPHAKCVGLDVAPEALRFCRQRGPVRLVRGSVLPLPVADRSMHAILSLDVIYHRAVRDDRAALAEFARALADDGILILNLPAYRFMISSHDRAIHTARRYTPARLRKLLQEAGLEPEFLSFRNCFLFPPAAAVRIARKILPSASEQPRSDLAPLPKGVNALLLQILRAENTLLRRRIPLPFGLSVFCIARKAAS